MARHQLGKQLDAEQVDLLVAFLESLTGRVDADYVARPTLPESGPETPGAG
jgi:cytochrome c peroxidase